MAEPAEEKVLCLLSDVSTCIICLEPTDEEAGCACKGTAGHVHNECLATWRGRFAHSDYRKWVCPQCGALYADAPADDATRRVVAQRQTVADDSRRTDSIVVTVVGWMCLSLMSDIGAESACFLPDRCRNAWLALLFFVFDVVAVVAAPTAARKIARVAVGSLALLSLVPTDNNQIGPFIAVFDALVASTVLAI